MLISMSSLFLLPVQYNAAVYVDDMVFEGGAGTDHGLQLHIAVPASGTYSMIET